MLTQRGISDRDIGMSYLLSLPWAFKFAAAPWVDSRADKAVIIHRLQWVVAALLISFGVVSLSFAASPSWLAMFLIVVGLTNAASAMQDVATDGLAIEVLASHERGLANGVQVAAYRVGMILGGGILPLLLGSERTLPALGVAVLLTSLPLWWLRSHVRPLAKPERQGPTLPSLRRLWSSVARPDMRTWIGVLLVYKLGEAIATSMLRPMLIRFGVDASVVYGVFGTTGFVTGLLGAMLGGFICSHMPRRKALFLLALFQAITILAWVPVADGYTSTLALHAACAIEHLGSGMATAALFSVMMDATRPHHEATDYAVQASVVVLGSGLGSVLGGYTTSIGYVPHIVLGATLAFAAALWVGFLQHRNRLPDHAHQSS